MPDSPSLSSDAWLSDILSVPTFVVTSMSGDIPEADGPRFLYAKIDGTDTARAQWLDRHGFRLADETVTFEKTIDGGGEAHPACRLAEPQDEDKVAAIARTAFSCDRFHRDPDIADADADRVKESWARNYFRGDRGDSMVVAEDKDGTLSGFLQILQPDARTHVIDLIAVDERARGQGLGRALIHTLESQARPGDIVRVGTQQINKASFALYEKLGFRPCGAQRVYHRHDS